MTYLDYSKLLADEVDALAQRVDTATELHADRIDSALDRIDTTLDRGVDASVDTTYALERCSDALETLTGVAFVGLWAFVVFGGLHFLA